jgi:pimeloyl-ACP methyl ester carboxylesterase
VGERSHLASDAINLSTHIDDVVNEIKWKDLDGVVLVGHSYGGMVITGVAERIRERIAAIVYLDAFLPADGQALSDLSARPSWPEHVVPSPKAAAFHVNAKDAAWVDSKTTPHPTACFTEKLHVTGAYQNIPSRTYIRALEFPMPHFDAALARCQADRAWKTIQMKVGHDVMLDQPAELVAILQRLG